MNSSKIICPKCGAEVELTISTAKSVATKTSPEKTVDTVCPKVTEKEKAKRLRKLGEMKSEEKIAALRKAGVDTSRLFSVTLSRGGGAAMLRKDDDGDLCWVYDDDPIFNTIFEKGCVPNNQLFRRWIMSQVFHMLATGDFLAALHSKGYRYQWDMTVEELKVQARLSANEDTENFKLRNIFFNKDLVMSMAWDYVEKLRNHVNALPVKSCQRAAYVRLGGKDIFTNHLCRKVFAPLTKDISRIGSSKTPEELYRYTRQFSNRVKDTWLKQDIDMAKCFESGYKGAGALFTMRNLILFHGCKFHKMNGRTMGKNASLQHLLGKAAEYKDTGWKLFGLMKEFLAYNNIDINQKMAEWQNR